MANVVDAIPGDIDVDVYDHQRTIQNTFPALAPSTKNVVHIRRAGNLSGQQLGQYMLAKFRAAGGKRLQGRASEISRTDRFRLDVEMPSGRSVVVADVLVNAAGPFINRIAAMLGIELPVKNIYQQKIAFEDHLGVIPRDMPFSIDLDAKHLSWSKEERKMLAEDPDLKWLADVMPPGTHCRPDGGLHGRWVKLGWAYNERLSTPQEDMANEPAIDQSFPEIVIRGAAEFIQALQQYIATPPPHFSHYGGYYTMTKENWPLIGPLGDSGAFVVGALSGFGSMAACAAGKLCAAHICSAPLPGYAADLSLDRLTNSVLLAELNAATNKGLL